MDRRQQRAALRRDVWRRAAEAAALALQTAYPETGDDELASLWRDTRAAVLAYLAARAAGALPSPPGGVGGSLAERTPKRAKRQTRASR